MGFPLSNGELPAAEREFLQEGPNHNTSHTLQIETA
jgi:hypothetical protein